MHCSSFNFRFWSGHEWQEVCLAGMCCSYSIFLVSWTKWLMRNRIECAISDIFVFFMTTLKGIAKLPFIDEARLLAEVARLEHTLTVWYMNLAYVHCYADHLQDVFTDDRVSLQEEEVRRNSIMFDMLFVALSHPLSPYIFSLNDRCKQLTDKERAEIKEQLDSRARFAMLSFH